MWSVECRVEGEGISGGCLPYRVTSRIRKRPPPLGPCYDPTQWPTVGSQGKAFSYDRGTPVGSCRVSRARDSTRPIRFQAKRELLKTIKQLVPGIQGQDMALTVLHVPYSLCNGADKSTSLR